MAPAKAIRLKSVTKWLNGEISEKIAARDKLFRKLKKSKLKTHSQV